MNDPDPRRRSPRASRSTATTLLAPLALLAASSLPAFPRSYDVPAWRLLSTTTIGGPGGDGAVEPGKGSGARGLTHVGRSRDVGGSAVYGGSASRPRRRAIARNSVLRFQKVVGFSIDDFGTPSAQWSTPIEYRVDGRRLLRVQDGRTSVVAVGVVGFRAELTDVGSILVTIVSQAATGRTGRVTFQANQIEVMPKN